MDAISRGGESRACAVAFPAEVQREKSEELGPLDFAADEQEEVLGMQMSDAKEEDQEFMDQLKLDGFPPSRRRPKTRMVGTSEKDSSIHSVLAHNDWSQAEASHGSDHEGRPQSRYCQRVKYFRCDHSHEKTSGVSVKAPSAYSFNDEFILDVLKMTDMVQQTFPVPKKRWDKFLSRWTPWDRFPQIATTDRELHNRGRFCTRVKSNGVHLRQAGTAAPEHIGRGERHDGIIKNMMKAAIKYHHLLGKDQMEHCAIIAQIIKNGLTPRQNVVSRSSCG